MDVVCRARALFDEAFEKLLTSDLQSIFANVSERNICNRLSLHMETLKMQYGFSNYYAETEYNRKQNAKLKTILVHKSSGKAEIIIINPDLILHSRGESIIEDNIIAIEMKKSGRNRQETLDDVQRLITMTKSSFNDVWSNDGTDHPEHVCGYQVGFYILLNISAGTFKIWEFQKGQKISERLGKLETPAIATTT